MKVFFNKKLKQIEKEKNETIDKLIESQTQNDMLKDTIKSMTKAYEEKIENLTKSYESKIKELQNKIDTLQSDNDIQTIYDEYLYGKKESRC